LPSVLVIGDVMTDIVVKPEGPIAVGADTRATIRMLPGGSGANQAAWLAAEGISVRFAARVGRDDYAVHLAVLEAQGVDARLGVDEALPTGQIVTLVSADERSFLTDRGANEALCRADLPDELLDGVDLVEVSGYVLFHPGPRAAVLDLLAEAKRRDIGFAVDPSSWSLLQEVGREDFLAWTAGADICFPNRSEAAVLAGSDDPDEQLAILCRTYRLVVIKCGTEAAIAAERGTQRRWSAPVPRVEAVDASGGGDAFFAGFIGAYLRGGEVESCLRRGVELGARAAATLGGRPPASLARQPLGSL
jgi:sugar/nucleoside kinase (ribokinase family)